MKQLTQLPGNDQVDNNASVKGDRQQGVLRGGGVENIDVGYSGLKDHLKKSSLLLAKGQARTCAVCTERLGSSSPTALVCPSQNCEALSHMSCLSKRFLDEEGGLHLVVPRSGSCPQCKMTTRWMDLVKEMSLRVHGESEVKRLMKKPIVRKAKVMKGVTALEDDGFTDGMVDGPNHEADYDLGDALCTGDESVQPLAADWYCLVDSEDDVMSVASAGSRQTNYLDALGPSKSKLLARKFETVIEDSDWSNAEILD